MKMIRAFLPEADTIGILYTTSEPNSVAHLKTFQELAPDYGFTIEAVGITNESEVASGAATLVAKGVDCVNNFTDNNVVNNLSTLLHATDEAGIPVFGSEEEQVRNGCVASESLDYVALGAENRRDGGRCAQRRGRYYDAARFRGGRIHTGLFRGQLRQVRHHAAGGIQPAANLDEAE